MEGQKFNLSDSHPILHIFYLYHTVLWYLLASDNIEKIVTSLWMKQFFQKFTKKEDNWNEGILKFFQEVWKNDNFEVWSEFSCAGFLEIADHDRLIYLFLD